jgi:hypothetical protein
MAVVRNLWTPILSRSFWRADALFAVFLTLLVSGATIIVMMCLLVLADLTENWRADTFGQIILQRTDIGQTNKSEFVSDRNVNLRRFPDLSGKAR